MSSLNKTVLIAGASGGMGKVLADFLATRVTRLILVDRRRKKTKWVNFASVQEFHGVDVTDYRAVRRLALTLRRKRIRIDWIINFVGWVGRATSFGAQTPKQINQLVSANLLAVLYITRELTALLQPGGGIVNISSTTGLRPNGRYAVYSAAKAGVIVFTQAMARSASDLVPRNLSFIVLCPGPTNTPMRQHIMGDAAKHQSPLVIAHAIDRIIVGKSYRNGDVIVIERGHSRIVVRHKQRSLH